MNFNHFDKNKSRQVFSGIVASVYHREFDDYTYEYVVTPSTARIIPITKDDKIIILKEKLFSHDSPFFSLPGGIIDAGETPEQAATRELLEETGFKADSLSLWMHQNYSQTIISDKYFYIAKNCHLTDAPVHEQHENIEVLALDFDDFINKVISTHFKHIELQNEFLRASLDPGHLTSLREKLFS